MSEDIYRTAYTEGYQQAIKDVTAYKIPKITAKKFSIDELKKWQTFQDEYYDDFCIPPNAQNFIPTQKNKINNLKYVYVIRGSRVNPTKSNYKIGFKHKKSDFLYNVQLDISKSQIAENGYQKILELI